MTSRPTSAKRVLAAKIEEHFVAGLEQIAGRHGLKLGTLVRMVLEDCAARELGCSQDVWTPAENHRRRAAEAERQGRAADAIAARAKEEHGER